MPSSTPTPTPKGIKVSDQQIQTFEAAHLTRHPFHGDWKYTITAHASK
jgi:hypothetical protein